MSHGIRKFRSVGLIAILTVVLLLVLPSVSADETNCDFCHSDVAESFTKSPHYTENCTACHIYHKYIPSMGKCIECHTSPGTGYVLKANVHYEQGLICIDCHSKEIHGDYAAQAGRAKCGDCHTTSGPDPTYDPTIAAHKMHENDVSCVACHVRWYYTYNFNMDTGKITPEICEFHLLNYKDKLYPACEMNPSGTKSYLRVTFPHTISEEGRDCTECHDRFEEVFYLGFDGGMLPPEASLSLAPPYVEVQGFDITEMGTYLLIGVLFGIFVHLMVRRIMLRRWIG